MFSHVCILDKLEDVSTPGSLLKVGQKLTAPAPSQLSHSL